MADNYEEKRKEQEAGILILGGIIGLLLGAWLANR